MAVDVDTRSGVSYYLPGPLMLAIMGCLWRDSTKSLAGLHRYVCREHKPVAMSTLSTTITRLLERGWLIRYDYGMYRAGISRNELLDIVTEAIREA